MKTFLTEFQRPGKSWMTMQPEDYYKLTSEPPVLEEGDLLLEKKRGSNALRLTRHDGQWVGFDLYDPQLRRLLVREGMPESKVEAALTHVVNFGRIVVATTAPES